MSHRLIVAALLGLLSFAPGALAKNGLGGDWELGAYMGLAMPDNYGTADLEVGPLAGFRAGYFLTEELSVETSFQRAFTEVSGSGANVFLDSVRVNGLWNFLPSGVIRPFVTAGAGWERVDLPAPVEESAFGINAGVGTRWFFASGGGLRLDARYVTAAVGGAVDGRQHNFELAAGLFWTFGSGSKAKAVQEKAPLDSDGDGVPDDMDECPGTPEGTEVDESGCPVVKDSDGDGVPDSADRCPATPEGTEVDDMGCPREGRARGVLKGVIFKTGSAELADNARSVLDTVAEDLEAFPDITVEVQGHTDSRGASEINLRLSKARAEAVRDYLIERGADGDRLTARGYGDSMPMADNATAEGRNANRRVEMKWIE